MPRFVPYSAIARRGLVGDRRTTALVAADGTVDWLCLPDCDGAPHFGALLDASAGGWWRLGPARLLQGEQRYDESTAVLVTTWDTDEARLELTDAMLWPEDERAPRLEGRRVLLRRLRCVRGAAPCVSFVVPRKGVASAGPTIWHSRAFDEPGGAGRFALAQGDVVWAALDTDTSARWTAARCGEALEEVRAYWRSFVAGLRRGDGRTPDEPRAAITIHLLAYAPEGSVVAAPTTSLPERVGGSWNADYRLSWVRDASLSLGALAKLGDLRAAGRYLDWLSGLHERLALRQPMFSLHGAREPRPHEESSLGGYRGSRPVVFGNHAYEQRQIGSLGFLADCAWTYVRLGGRFDEAHWTLVRDAADRVVATWMEPDNGIWELTAREHYVASRVMSWVALDRASKIARRCARSAPLAAWQAAMDAIQREVAERGWSPALKAFRQRYGAETLDAAALLIPIMGFLPYDDPRVVQTIERVAERLTIDELVYRFDPEEIPGMHDVRPLGQFEGAFVPCCAWLATAFAGLGRRAPAERILTRIERVAGELRLLGEAIDPRDGTFLGNFPLLFSHSEHLRALHALRDMAR